MGGLRWPDTGSTIRQMRRIILIGFLLCLALSGCGAHGPTGVATPPSTHVVTVSPTVSVLPTQPANEPDTLVAATAAAQELANRFSSADYAGVWEMKSKEFRDQVSQNDYVTYNNTCTLHNPMNGSRITVTGLRMEGTDKALVRWDVAGAVQITYTMVYEDGKWLEVMGEFWERNLGKPVDQVIAQSRLDGNCAG